MGTSARDKVTLRGVEFSDLPLLLAWRSDREIMQYLPSAPLKPTWEEHLAYWGKSDYRSWMIELSEEGTRHPVGIVHIIPSTGEAGIIIGEKSLWGKGLATEALSLMLARARKYKITQEQVWAAIHPENTASQKVFAKVGFVNTHEPARNGQERWVLR